MSQTKVQCKNKQRAITPNLCTVLLLNKIYLHTQFLVDTFCSFRVMSQTKLKNERRAKTHNLGKAELRFL